MPYEPNFGEIQSAGEPLPAPKATSPFRIAFLADLSGRQNRGATGSTEDVAARRLLRVGRDTLDDVMAKLAVQLELPVGEDGATATLSFASLDDFHPDQIHDRVDQIMDLYDAEEKSAAMNALLHHPEFQALESAWRGLAWLLSRAAKGGQVEFVLLDVALSELEADLKASDDLTTSGLHRLLIDKGVRGPQGEPWALLVGDYLFELSGEHAELLGRLAKIAGQTKAPFLATVNPEILDASFALSEDAAPAWQALRELPEAALLGLAVPRFLLRLPYGENTQSIDKFSYEEMSRTPDRSHYLWGNPALACATLIAQAFQKEGWACKPGAIRDLGDLPIHVYTVDGDQEVTLAEAWLLRPQPERLVKQGFMPFLCVRGEGSIQLTSFLSLAQPGKNEPASELIGRWSQKGVGPAPSRAALPGATVGVVGQMPKPAPKVAPARAPEPEPEPEAAAEEPSAPPEEPVAEETPAEEPAAEEPVAEEPAAEETPAEETSAAGEATPAEEEMDPDLAALLKELE